MEELLYISIFSPEFTGQRAQLVSRDHAPHLDIVVVSTMQLLHVYLCQQSILVKFNVDWVPYLESRQFSKFKYRGVLQVAVKNILVLGQSQRAHCWFRGGAKEHIVDFGANPKGTLESIALWKRS